MPPETRTKIAFHPSTPHLKAFDRSPVAVLQTINDIPTPCLRWYGVASGNTIWGVLFFFPLIVGRSAADLLREPTDFAVIMVSHAKRCPRLDTPEAQSRFRPDEQVVWLARFDNVPADHPTELVVAVCALGDPLCGPIVPRGAWLREAYEKYCDPRGLNI